MKLKKEDFVERLKFLDLDYCFAIRYSGKTYDSLEQAMIALLCSDTVVWQLIVSFNSLEDTKTLLPEIVTKMVDRQTIIERLINICLQKLDAADIYDKMFAYTDHMNTEFEFVLDYNGPHAEEIKSIVQPYYDIVSKIHTMYRRGITTSLELSEQLLGELS